MKIGRINRTWARCVAIAGIPLVPFFMSLVWSGILTETVFENGIVEPFFSAYLVPGMIPSALLWGVLSNLMGLSDHLGVTLTFISGGIISMFFWGTIFWVMYIGFLALRKVADSR